MALLGKDDPRVLLMTATMPVNSMYIFLLWKLLLILFKINWWQMSVPNANCRDSLDLRQKRTQGSSLRASASQSYSPPHP